ncbi:hypothetical protein [Alloprevotella tannerae]|uniref:hypothetical protein n=1 Tax=Alloprevotella tannerae TaxID=76122 RepID=UPI0025E1FA49|nr:hypothetical protein [Alloprevotella tannerae]
MVEIPFSFVLRLHNSFGDKDNAGLNINPHGASAHTSRLAMVRKFGLGTPKMAQRKNEGAMINFNGRKKYSADKALQAAKEALRRLLS